MEFDKDLMATIYFFFMMVVIGAYVHILDEIGDNIGYVGVFLFLLGLGVLVVLTVEGVDYIWDYSVGE